MQKLSLTVQFSRAHLSLTTNVVRIVSGKREWLGLPCIYTYIYIYIYIIYIFATCISQHKFYSLSFSRSFTQFSISLTFKRDALTLTQVRTRSRLRNYYNAVIVVEFLSIVAPFQGTSRMHARNVVAACFRYTRSLFLSLFLSSPGNSTRLARMSSLYRANINEITNIRNNCSRYPSRSSLPVTPMPSVC